MSFQLKLISALAVTFSLTFGHAALADGVANPCLGQAKNLVKLGYNEGGVYLENLRVFDSFPDEVLLRADWIFALDEAVPHSGSTYVRFSCNGWPTTTGIQDRDGDGAVTLNDAQSLETPTNDVGLQGHFRFTASSVACASGVFFDTPVVSPCVVPAGKILLVGRGSTQNGQSTLVSLARSGKPAVTLGKLSDDGSSYVVRVIGY